MKKLLVLVGIALLALGSEEARAHGRGWHGGGSVSFGVFYESLGPYGDWISVGGGMYGWRPLRVAAGWRPYTVGRWVWTDDGWYWLSEEPWGWATFHYGRWHYDDYYGWIWIPGYDWAPAWVEWRYGGGCVGWAPLSPYAVFSISWGIHYRTRWYTPHHWWNFVDCGYIAHGNVHRYVYRHDDNPRFIGRTRGGGSVRYDGGRIRSRGPEVDYIEREGRVRVASARIRDVEDRAVERLHSEGGRQQIDVYRPRVEERSDRSDDVIRPGRVREDRGRSIDLDTRNIDGRSAGVERSDSRDASRSDEYRVRERVPSGDINTERGRAGEDQIGREARSRNREIEEQNREREQIQKPDVSRETPRNEQPRWRTNEGRSRDAQPQVQPEPRERRRDEGSDRRSREDRSFERGRNPEMNPAPRMEMPRNEQPPRASGGSRNEGGRRR